MTTIDILKKTRAARGGLAVLDEDGKNALLLSMADSLLSHEGAILTENAADMADARGHISDVMLDRLRLDHDRLAGMADGVRAIAALPDHTGRVLSEVRRPNGLVIQKVQVPLGLVSIIYESRPNVTSDAAALALKSGNVCVLRSGREAYRTARAIVQALKAGIAAEGGDPDNSEHRGRHHPPVCRGHHDRQGSGGPADPPGRRGTDPGLRGRRHRALH